MKLNREDVKIGLFIAGAFLGWQYVLKPVLEGVGLKDTADERDQAKTQRETENLVISKDYWNPSFYQKPPNGYDSIILTQAWVDGLAAKIWNAAGWFNDDEEAIYGAFRQLDYRTHVSFLARRFFDRYGKDLYTWLRDSVLSSSELNTVLQITNKLPNGFKNKNTGKVV